jgi:hypothetical protein
VWNFARTPPADSIPAFRLTARILTRFADDVRRDGRRFVLIAQAAPEIADQETMAWYTSHSLVDLDKTDRWLTGIGARDAFDVVTLAPGFRVASGDRSRRLWIGEPRKYGHWNAAGHALAADILTDYFLKTLPDSVVVR